MKFRLEKKRKKVKPPSKLALALAPWRVQIIVGTTIVVVGSLLLTSVWYVTHLPRLQITDVAVIGGSTIPHETITAATEEALVGSYYRIIPYTFGPLYPETRIMDQLLQIPRVKEVRFDRDGQKLIVVFTEYQPYALWCEDAASTECLFIDDQGFAFSKAPQLTGSALVRYVQLGATPSLKTEGFTPAFMSTTGTFAERLEDELKLYVTDIVRKDDVDTSYILSTGAEIKVSERMTAEETFVNLRTIFASEDFADIADGNFHYIDLRFGDKVFVSEVEVVATSTATSTSVAE